jgi:hypothetical protein
MAGTLTHDQFSFDQESQPSGLSAKTPQNPRKTPGKTSCLVTLDVISWIVHRRLNERPSKLQDDETCCSFARQLLIQLSLETDSFQLINRTLLAVEFYLHAF